MPGAGAAMRPRLRDRSCCCRRRWPAFLVAGRGLRRRLRRWPRAARPRAGADPPGQPHHRPPRRAAAGPAQHRLAPAGVDAARRHGVRPRHRPASLPRRSWCCSGWPPPPPLAQVVAWCLEGVRRLPHGIAVVRVLLVAALGAALVLQMDGSLVPLLDRIPTTWWSSACSATGPGDGRSPRWWCSACCWLRPWSGRCRRTSPPGVLPRDELRVETGTYAARAEPRSDARRPGPHRPGIGVARGPHAPRPGRARARARAWSRSLGDLPWSSMTVLPGLVASGGALLYGVNAWCLDARGSLWRESLPVGAGRGVRGPGLRARRVPAGRLHAHRRAGRDPGRRAVAGRADGAALHPGGGHPAGGRRPRFAGRPSGRTPSTCAPREPRPPRR